MIGHLSSIMADDYEISDVNKCIEDIINSYNKERIHQGAGMLCHLKIQCRF